MYSMYCSNLEYMFYLLQSPKKAKQRQAQLDSQAILASLPDHQPLTSSQAPADGVITLSSDPSFSALPTSTVFLYVYCRDIIWYYVARHCKTCCEPPQEFLQHIYGLFYS